MHRCDQLTSVRASIVAFVVGTLCAPGLAFSATRHTAPSHQQPFDYNTSGAVGIGANPASVNGPSILQFQGITGASFDPKSTDPINLGQFVVAPSLVAAGQTTTYSGTPFEVEIQTPEFNKTSSVPVLAKIFPTFGKRLDLKTVIENSLLLKGHLDGTVGANGQAHVTATVDSIKLGSMEAQSQQNHVTHYAFPIRYSQLRLPSSWVMSRTNQITTSTTSHSHSHSTTVATSTSTGGIAPAPAAEMLITPTPTPEPSTVVFFAVALGGLLLGRRRLSTR